MKLLIIGNNVQSWRSWDSKIKDLEQWFEPLSLNIDLIHTSYQSIPIEDQGLNLDGVDRQWYNNNVSSLATDYDIVLFVMPTNQNKPGNRQRGRTDNNDLGPWECYIWCDENEKVAYNNFPDLPAFYQFARHEITHALYAIAKVQDNCHYWWDQGNFEAARKELVDQLITKPALITKIQNLITYLYSLIKTTMTPQQKLLDTAKSFIGKDASPKDLVSDSYGCAETVSNIVKLVYPTFPILTGTWSIFDAFRGIPVFQSVKIPGPGDIILSVTGMGNGIVSNGHVGIVGENGVVMSNDSNTGLFKENYTVDSWKKYYGEKGGFPIYYFSKVK